MPRNDLPLAMKSLILPPVISALGADLMTRFRSRRSMPSEIIALRHQLAVYQQSVKRPTIGETVYFHACSRDERLISAALMRVTSSQEAQGNHSGTNRVQDDRACEFSQVALSFNHNTFVPTLQQVSHALMTSRKMLGIGAV